MVRTAHLFRSRLFRRLLVAVTLAVVPVGVAAYINSLPSCGAEGEEQCGLLTWEYLTGGLRRCDLGLDTLGFSSTCVSVTRRRAGVDDWADWALRNQQTLGIDEPINWISRLATHNAYNNASDGYVIPNQYWSLTDQLRMGSRHFQLDPHWDGGNVRLCHAGEFGLFCPNGSRFFSYGIREIRKWLDDDDNQQILTLDFEDHAEDEAQFMNDPLNSYFGAKVYTPGYKAANSPNRLPTSREMVSSGKRVFIFSHDTHGGTWIHQQQGLAFNFPSGAKLHEGEANLRFNPQAADCVTGVKSNNQPNGFPVLHPDNRNLFSWVAEDRAWSLQAHWLTAADVELAVRCGISLIYLDDFARPYLFSDDTRHHHAIWSWTAGDKGGTGDAALLQSATTPGEARAWNRWISANPNSNNHFVCGRPRAESSIAPETWPDRFGHNWRVTTATGPWRDGGLRCLEEFGPEYVFSVPTNGYRNVRASMEVVNKGNAWLNYNDIKTEGSWTINKRPFANAGQDQQLQCTTFGGATTTLNASGSSDPEGDPLRFFWPPSTTPTTNPSRSIVAPVGSTTYRLIVDDTFAGVSQDDVVVTVTDSTAPVIGAVTPSQTTLWPPDGKMVPVSVTAIVNDTCDPNASCRIVSIDSSETNPRRGNSVRNGVDAELTGPLSALLRAERSGPDSGRLYTITVRCSDGAGNFSERKVSVTVPHDQR